MEMGKFTSKIRTEDEFIMKFVFHFFTFVDDTVSETIEACNRIFRKNTIKELTELVFRLCKN